MRMYDLITKKKHGKELSKEEIYSFVREYTDGKVPDYQASAFFMAVYFKGMTTEETSTFTMAMAESGDMLDLSEFGELTVDKHSTGGVGDKTTLIVAPIAASLGCKVAKMSGRGLGHTGGTVDKLESFPGYRTSLSPEEFMNQVRRVGISVIGQSGDLAPADKRFYALRDVTATVDSIPLITSSIMSKKLAAGSHSIVLDVKCGSGSFMKTAEDAERLASGMVDIGKACGRKIAALITNMDTPLGYAIGNALEIKEAIEVLRGNGPSDLSCVAIELATAMVRLSLKKGEAEARAMVLNALDSGKALDTMRRWIEAQGGDPTYVDDTSKFGEARYVREVKAVADGYIGHLNAETIGIASVMLGAGRVEKTSPIDHQAGIMITKKPGDRIAQGVTVAVLYTNDEATIIKAEETVLGAITITKEPPESLPLIYKVVG